ncbi:MAG: Hpt domain-containing protein [Thermodesulfobacteriota bacterium]|nr:Hpt domain-containing protein [Thermodesulfobacteriota bacterium]
MTEPTQPINMEELMEIMDHNIELVKDCFNDFVSDYPEMLADIKNAIDISDGPLLSERAHKIKGTLTYLAAIPAASLAYKLEVLGKNGDVERSMNIFYLLEEECETLKKFVTQYKG